MPAILLIEPDSRLGAIYAEALRTAGHEVVASASAQAALQAADLLKPDLVVLELELATHNGMEFLYEFRSYSEWQKVPIMILTHKQPSIATSLLAAGDDMGISAIHYKPATKLATLIKAVEQILTSNTKAKK